MQYEFWVNFEIVRNSLVGKFGRGDSSPPAYRADQDRIVVGASCIRLLWLCDAVLGDAGRAQNAPTHSLSTEGGTACAPSSTLWVRREEMGLFCKKVCSTGEPAAGDDWPAEKEK